MESNFHLDARVQDQNLHIQLHGVFDGASAFELIQAIEEHPDQKIVIETRRLTRTYEYGRHVLQSHLPPELKRSKLLFAGDQAKSIMPEGCRLLKYKDGKKHVCKGKCKNCTCHRQHDDAFTNLRFKTSVKE